MDFNPSNNVVKHCLQGMGMEDKGNPEEASALFLQAWKEATNDFEKFIAAHYVARHQKTVPDQIKWLETMLQLAATLNDSYTTGALPSVYTKIAKCYEDLNEPDKAQQNYALAMSFTGKLFDLGPFYHGTKANLQVGDLLTAGFRSNYHSAVIMNHIYFTAQVNGAGLAAALSKGDGAERVFVVEPTGSFENDPNVTDKKFPGNPTRSYRSTAPLKIVGEITEWVRQTPEELRRWQERIAKTTQAEIIN